MALGSAFRRGNNAGSGGAAGAAAGEGKSSISNCPVITTTATGLVVVAMMLFAPRDITRLENSRFDFEHHASTIANDKEYDDLKAKFEQSKLDQFMNVNDEHFMNAKMLIAGLFISCLFLGGSYFIIQGHFAKHAAQQISNVKKSATLEVIKRHS